MKTNKIEEDYSLFTAKGYAFPLPSLGIELKHSNKSLSEDLTRWTKVFCKEILLYNSDSDNILTARNRFNGDLLFRIEHKGQLGHVCSFNVGNYVVINNDLDKDKLVSEFKNKRYEIKLFDINSQEVVLNRLNKEGAFFKFPKRITENEFYCNENYDMDEKKMHLSFFSYPEIKPTRDIWIEGLWTVSSATDKYIHLGYGYSSSSKPKYHKILDYESLEVLWEFYDEDFFTEEDEPYLTDRNFARWKITEDSFLYKDLLILLKATGVVAIDLKTGKVIWNITTGFKFGYSYSRWQFDPHRLELFGYYNAYFARINALTGEILVEKDLKAKTTELSGGIDAFINHGLTQSKTHLFTTMYQQQMVIAVNKETGEIDWHYKSPHGIYGDVRVFDNCLYIKEALSEEHGLVVTYFADENFDWSLAESKE